MELQTARGVKDTLPEEKILKNQVVDNLRNVFENYGFLPLETPILERYETLAAKFAAGEDSDALKETFQLTDQGNRKLGLRFDLTVPLARFVAMNPNLKMPFKRYEMGVVFRDGPIKAGRVRQFWQCDVDIIGTSSMLADAEIISIVDSGFKKLKVEVNIKINNRKLLNGILNQCQIKDKEEVIISIDKLEKIGQKGVSEELKQRGYKETQIKTLFSLVKEGITLAELKDKIEDEEAREGIKELEELFSYLKLSKINSALFDVSLARGLAYYTGTVFEAFAKTGPITSSLAAGGRWDEMIGKFMDKKQTIPAVGVSFGLTPLLEVLKDDKPKTVTQIFVIPIKTIKESLPIVQQLREAGINASIDLNERGMSKNLQYVNALSIPYALIIGEKELKEKKALLRDMKTGDQKLLTIEQIIKKLHFK